MTSAAARRLKRLWGPADSEDAWAWLKAMRRSVIKAEIVHVLPSEWATKKRVLPAGLTSLPGPFRWEVTPYWREVLDCLAPASPVREIYVMKGAQVGYTVAVLENHLGYIIDCEPGPTLYMTGDAGMAEATMSLRVDRMIESAGIAHKIFAQVKKKANKASGDTKSRKEFPGGFIFGVGPNSGAKLRSLSIQYLEGDELDAMTQEVGGKTAKAVTASEGDPWFLALRRTDSYQHSRKILGGSTPLIKQTSRIAALHAEGDARRFFVPCKHCNEMQPLEWKQIRYDKDDAGRLVWGSVRYECAKCGKPWKNEDKAYFLPRGEWRPTQEARRPGVRSYHLSSLYSPIGMRPWEDVCEEWIRAQGDPNKLRVFVNTVLGEPFEERGDSPKPERIMLRRQDYAPEVAYVDPESGGLKFLDAAIPEGVLCLTLGADVQSDRIESELLGWGKDKESWSLGYHRLEGDTSDRTAGAWALLREVIFHPRALPLSLVLIDSGFEAPIVQGFIDAEFTSGVLPSKGASNTVGKGRIFAIRDIPGYLCKRVDLDEAMLKSEFYAQSRVGPVDAPPDGAALPAGYCHFPEAYERRYFEMLFSERVVTLRTQTGTRQYWDNEGRRNEALDCRVLNLGALYVVAADATATEDDPASVDWAGFWEYLASQRS